MRFALALALMLVPALAHAQPVEAWIALGDALVARGDVASLEEALAAYDHVAASDAAYPIALEHAAWTAFLLDRTPDAIARYSALLDRVPAGPTRDEAIVLLGALFADPDWDRDGVPDAASAIDRLADPALVAQDRPWLAELTFETAHALYLSSRDPAAIALWARALERWPAPENGTAIGQACRRHRARPTTLRGEDAGVRRTTDVLCARYAP